MGAGKVKAAVADAGPLIHLTQISSLSLLQIFETLHIPDVVWSETVDRGRLTEADVLNLGNVRRHTLSLPDLAQFTQQNSLQNLQAGECGSLYLCKQSGVDLVLTDDLAARDAANLLSLTPVGSLGIVVKAYWVGDISLVDAERLLNDLYSISSLFVTRAIVELAIEQLRKHSDQN